MTVMFMTFVLLWVCGKSSEVYSYKTTFTEHPAVAEINLEVTCCLGHL